MKRLPEAEQELMMIIWEYEEPVSRFQIEEKLDPQKEIAPSTILTLLTRLEKRGFLEKVKNGKSNLYRPLVKKKITPAWLGKRCWIRCFKGHWRISRQRCIREKTGRKRN
ncbi:MAG: BlaI/MecI/CopY family transcriptional regulator [Blautia sp.]